MSRTTVKRLAQLEEWLRDPSCKRALLALAQSYMHSSQNSGTDKVTGRDQYGSWLVWFTPVRMVLNRSGCIEVFDRRRLVNIAAWRKEDRGTHIDVWERSEVESAGLGMRQVLNDELPDNEAERFVSDMFCWIATGNIPAQITCSIGSRNWHRLPERNEDAK